MATCGGDIFAVFEKYAGRDCSGHIASKHKAVDPELSATENVAVLSSLYDTYECPRIIEADKSYAGAVKHFDDLIAKSGNGFVNAMAYGSERSKALAHQHAAERAMKEKGCSPDPPKIDNKAEAHHR
jgi:hypothetical protein